MQLLSPCVNSSSAPPCPTPRGGCLECVLRNQLGADLGSGASRSGGEQHLRNASRQNVTPRREGGANSANAGPSTRANPTPSDSAVLRYRSWVKCKIAARLTSCVKCEIKKAEEGRMCRRSVHKSAIPMEMAQHTPPLVAQSTRFAMPTLWTTSTEPPAVPAATEAKLMLLTRQGWAPVRRQDGRRPHLATWRATQPPGPAVQHAERNSAVIILQLERPHTQRTPTTVMRSTIGPTTPR